MRRHQSVRVIYVAAGLVISSAIVMPLRPVGVGRACAESLLLFTAWEARHLRLTTREWQTVAMPRALSVGPRIIVRRPKIVPGDIPTIEAQSPTDLDVTFQPRGAPVRMDSLNVEARKGFFSKPLTAMLRPYIHGDSIAMSQVEIPTGRFLLDISIADINGNTTDATYRLEVNRQ